jgi:hypothetical protein
MESSRAGDVDGVTWYASAGCRYSGIAAIAAAVGAAATAAVDTAAAGTAAAAPAATNPGSTWHCLPGRLTVIPAAHWHNVQSRFKIQIVLLCMLLLPQPVATVV